MSNIYREKLGKSYISASPGGRVQMGVELVERLPQLFARLLLRKQDHPLEVDRKAEAEHGFHKHAEGLCEERNVSN